MAGVSELTPGAYLEMIRMGVANKAAYLRGRNHPISMRSHSLQFVPAGSGALVIDSREWPLSVNDAIFVFPGETFDVQFHEDSFTRYYFTFRVGDYRDGSVPAPRLPARRNRVLSFEGPDSLLPQCMKIYAEFVSTQPLARQIAQAAFAEMLYRCARTAVVRRDAAFGSAVRKNMPALAAARAAAEKRCAEGLTPADLARTAGLSTHYFEGLFRQFTGLAVADYLMKCRIRKAQALLCESDAPIKEAAAATGFSDVHHFTKRFRRETGLTPGAFVRRMAEKN